MSDRELTVDELDVDGMVGSMHFRVGEAWALMGGNRDGTGHERVVRANDLRPRLWALIPFLKALGRLALEHPERTRQLWAEALHEPMPFGAAPLGMPRKEEP